MSTRDRLDAYIRVSAVSERDQSAPEQERQIKEWANRRGVKIAEWYRDRDVSGGKAPGERKLELALRRAESGETGGIVVWRIDRFGRSAIDTLLAVRRLKEAGARLVATEGEIDSATEWGQFVIGLFALLAERELERITSNWRTYTARAVDRGVHISGPVPAGYARENGSPLKLLPGAKPTIKQAFKMRADGASWLQIADFLTAKELASSRGSVRWSKQGAYALIHNRVYLGEARGPGGITKADAHPACVTPAEFAAAQEKDGEYAKRDGSISKQALFVGGMITCGGCGERLSVTGSDAKRRIIERSGQRWRCPTCLVWTRSTTGCKSCGSKLSEDGKLVSRREANYFCVAHRASGTCPEPAVARVSVVDAYVVEELMRRAEGGGVVAALEEDVADVDRAYADLQEAEAALLAWQEATAAVTDAAVLARGLEVRLLAVEEAKARVERIEKSQRNGRFRSVDLLTVRVMGKTPADIDAMPGDPVLVGEDEAGNFDGVGYVWNAAEVPIEVQREHIRQFVAGVVLHRADPARRRWQPISERVEIALVGE